MPDTQHMRRVKAIRRLLGHTSYIEQEVDKGNAMAFFLKGPAAHEAAQGWEKLIGTVEGLDELIDFHESERTLYVKRARCIHCTETYDNHAIPSARCLYNGGHYAEQLFALAEDVPG